MGRARRDDRIRERHIAFAKSTKHHIAPADAVRSWRSWDDAYDHAIAEIARREIVVETKRRGAINWLRFSERPTMVPAKRGPILLPWDWTGRSRRSQARGLTHELCHHEQDEDLVFYEALYLHGAWRWAIEIECYAQELWLMVASEVLGWPGMYSQPDRNRWIDRLARKIRASYGLPRRYTQAEVERETRLVLDHHHHAAFVAIRGS